MGWSQKLGPKHTTRPLEFLRAAWHVQRPTIQTLRGESHHATQGMSAERLPRPLAAVDPDGAGPG
jgi:hypothetical protein